MKSWPMRCLSREAAPTRGAASACYALMAAGIPARRLSAVVFQVHGAAILNSDFVDVFRRFGSVFRWIEWRDGGSLASGQGGRSAAAAMGLSRLGQSGKTT